MYWSLTMQTVLAESTRTSGATPGGGSGTAAGRGTSDGAVAPRSGSASLLARLHAERSVEETQIRTRTSEACLSIDLAFS